MTPTYICGCCNETIYANKIEYKREVLDVIDGRPYTEMIPCCPNCYSGNIDRIEEE